MKTLLAALFLLLASTAQATTYYTAKTGNDSNNCTQAQNSATPKLTIAGGLSCLSAGDTLLISSGTYTEAIEHDAVPSGGGSWATATRVLARSGNVVTIAPTVGATIDGSAVALAYSQSYIVFGGEDASTYGMVVDASSLSTGSRMAVRIFDGGSAHHIRIQNTEQTGSVLASSCTGDAPGNHHDEWIHNKIHNCGRQSSGGNPGGHGIYLGGSSNGLVERNEIYDVGCSPLVATAPTCLTGFGVHQYVASGSGNDNIVRYNTIHDSLAGILAGGGTGNQVYGNVLYNVGTPSSDNPYSIEIGYGSDSGTRVMNNTVYNAAYCMHLRNSSSGGYVQNNLCVAGAATVDNSIVDDGSGNTKDHNVFSADTTLVVDAATTRNYHIRNSGITSLINQGVNLSSYFTTDRDGISLPQGADYDIGAYEYVTPLVAARRRF